METSNQHFEALNQAQGQEPADDSIAPAPIRSPLSRQPTADTGNAEWLKHNLLSLDGGGIRGYWSLLALNKLIEYIAIEEEKNKIYHSFSPMDRPDHVCQASLTENEDRKIKGANSPTEILRETPATHRYLPCHYFDYICGSSTGALIAIMLGRFRMTVPDCLLEYRRLGHKVFGRPRMISTLRFGLGVRHKYKAARLEEAFKDVTRRRNEQLGSNVTGTINFPLGRGLCATSVTTMKLEAGGKLAKLHLIRSYDHEKQDTPDPSRGPTPGSTMHSERTDTNISTFNHPTRGQFDYDINYEKAQQFEVWKVARAATAANLYFEPLKIENADGGFAEFTDGGFSQANNPTVTGMRDIQDPNGKSSIGIVVSVGTSRKLKKDAKKAKFFSIVPDMAREFADTVTDPEKTHNDMQREHNKNKDFAYYRLNDPGGLQTELDEWEPKHRLSREKQGGAKTLDDMESAFAKWAAKVENQQRLQHCAAALIACRQQRSSPRSSSRWERFATGSQYECLRMCHLGTYYDRDQFTSHLREDHRFEGDKLKEEVSRCRKHWRYQAAPRDFPYV